MKRSTLFILFLFFTAFLFSENSFFSNEIKYTKMDRSISELDESIFTSKVSTEKPVRLDFNEIAILFDVKKDIDVSYFTIILNGVEYIKGDKLAKDTNTKSVNVAIGRKILGNIPLQYGKNTLQFKYEAPKDTYVTTWEFLVTTLGMDSFGDYAEDVFESRGIVKNLTIDPSGKILAFQEINSDYSAIKVINLNTNNIETVIESKITFDDFGLPEKKKKFFSSSPTWSCDGSFLFFISTKSGITEIWRSKISIDGLPSDLKQLSNFDCFTYDLAISPNNDLYFISDLKGYSGIYKVPSADLINSMKQFHNDISDVVKGSDKLLFSVSVSNSGNYIAFCEKAEMSLASIKICDKNGQLITAINDRNTENAFPAWSPGKDILAYYSNDALSVFNTITRKSQVIASYLQKPEWVIKPQWDPYGEAIYYIAEKEGLDTIVKTELNADNLNIHETKEIFSHRDYRIYESPVSNDYRYLAFSAFTTNYGIYKLKQNIQSSKTVIGFKANPRDFIELFSRKTGTYKSLGFYPQVYSTKYNVMLEKGDSEVNRFKYKINGMRNSVKTSNFKESIVVSNTDFNAESRLRNTLRSVLIPGWGNYKKNLKAHGNYNFLSSVGILSLGIAAYFIGSESYDQYENANSVKDIYEYRNSARKYYSISTGLVVTGSLYYIFNLLDTYWSKSDINKTYKKQHKQIYNKESQNIVKKKKIEGKLLKSDKMGEIKISSKQAKVSLFLSKNSSKEDFIGKTSYILDNDTYLTISDLSPGSYTLRAQKPFTKQYIKTIKITEGYANYEFIDLESTFLMKLKKFGYYSIPGYAQIKRNDTKKGYTVTSIAGLSLISGLYFATKSYTNYNDYQNSDNLDDLFQARDKYELNSSFMSTSFLILASSVIYNIIDAYIGENI